MAEIELPSVTAIIGFVNSRAFDNIPAMILEAAGQRGTAVHSEIAASLLGLWYEERPEIAGYMMSLHIWVKDFVEEVVAVEQDFTSPLYGVRGRPDAILRIRGDIGLSLVDWKTPKPLSRSWRVQLAGYRLLAEANGLKIDRVASLRLDKDGAPAKFQGYTKTLAADTNVFRSALNVWKFFNQEE
jgi:hypothetical protein